MTQDPSPDRAEPARPPFAAGFLDRLVVRYAIAIVVVGLGFLLRLPFAGDFGSDLPYVTLSPAVMLAAVLGGFGPGLLAADLAALGAAYWILAPVGQFTIEKSSDIIGLALFLGMGVLMSAVAGLYRETRVRMAAYDREQAVRETEQRLRTIANALPPPTAVARAQSRPPVPIGIFRRRLSFDAAFALVLVLLASVGAASYRNMTAAREADQREEHSYTVIGELDDLLQSLQGVEVGQRGFLITGDAQYLQPYAAALGEVDAHLTALRTLTMDDPRQQQRVDAIEPLVRRKLAALQASIALRSTKGFQAASEALAAGRDEQLMAEIGSEAEQAEQEEALLLKNRIAAKEASNSSTIRLVVLGAVLGGIILMVVFVFFKLEFARRHRIEQDLRVYQEHLKELVEARTRELRASEERLRVTLTSIGDAVLVSDAESRVTFLNPVAVALTGWRPEDAVGQPVQRVFNIINGQTREPAADIVGSVLREKRAVALANRTELVTKDGREFPIEDSAAPILDAAGNLTGVVLVFHDVTEKRRAQEALRESEERFRGLFERHHAMMLVVEPETGAIVDANAAATRFYGYSREQLCARCIQDINQLPAAEVAAERQQAVAEKRNYFLFPHRLANGEVRWVEVYSTPVETLGRSLLYSIIHDVTDRKRAERALQTTLQRFYHVLSSMYSAVLLVTDEGRVEFANQALCDRFGLAEAPADLVGLASSEMMEKIKNAYLHPDEAAARIREILERGQPVKGEELAMQGGRTCLRDFVPVSVQGKSYGRLWLHIDITERKLQEEQLRKLNRTLQALSNSSQALVRATDEKAYLQDVCRMVVEDCGHAMVWIGFAEGDEARSVRPVASAGFEAGYLETLQLTWADAERGRGPTGTAIRTAAPSRCSNMDTDSAFAPWREQALKRGYAASLALPLLAEGKAFGAITIYSREPDPFSDEEVKLLSGLADDLAYGIVALRLRLARDQAEKALLENQRDLSRAQAVSQTGSWRLDIRKNELVWSDENYRIFGIPKGAPLTYESFLNTVHPEDRAMVDREWNAALRGKPYDIVHRIVVGDIVKWVRQTVELEFDQEGSLVGGFGTTRDITDRKRAEEALEQARLGLERKVNERTFRLREFNSQLISEIATRQKREAELSEAEFRYRTVAEFTQDWEYWETPEHTLRYCSPACEEITGYTSGELIADPGLMQRMVHPEDAGVWRDHRHDAPTALKPGIIQYRILRKDGGVRWLEHACRPVLAEGGAFLGIRAGNRDVTGRREAELETQGLRNELAHVARVATLGELAASLAHELNQPLGAILCNAEAARSLLDSGSGDLTEVRGAIGDIIEDDQRAGQVIRRLRAMFRKEAVERQPLNVNDLVQDTLALLRSELVLKNVSAQLELAPELPPVIGGRVELQQVLMNLVLNAADAMASRDSGQRDLRIQTVVDGPRAVRVSISDCGAGLPAELMAESWAPFFTTKRSGMGMGLSISRSIIESHGGRLWAVNNPDQGATFHFTLPVPGGDSA